MPDSHSPLDARVRELAGLIERSTGKDGFHTTAIPALNFSRLSAPMELPMRGVQEAALCLIVQGAKRAILADEVYDYDASRFVVASVDLPVTGQVTEASVEAPYLCLILKLSAATIAEMVTEAESAKAPLPPPSRGLFLQPSSVEMLDAAIRLVKLLDTPRDIPLLAPLVEREILYRVLCSPQGAMLRHIGIADSQGQRVAKAIHWLREHYAKPLRIDHIAREVHMSASALHHHFKAVTAMSPLQYQKQLRLQEARRLMLSEVLDAASAGHRVGYESPSQFSREYSRMFGAPPVRDVERLRNL
ncbi:AraC-like DNA-binding protein [Pseudoxanthomonas japonensis]|uniref:AraC family transcriptional regulator n=1 Tax=Pseudoxanthomonas japonensis TaxID=69284 RepID=UPI001A5D1490|nr:AraC family transcriptional regulator [Pseudoxanthomonas japonensis]MBL8256090.1 AraC family transcriptional regulator [Pseudoxanthomonas mexicana]MDR7070067.1 AraC-like DNA-binding protein [Pseudoxanthomonas japonensis]